MTDYIKLLKDLKKSNKERKLKLALKAGFATVESYLDYLDKQVLSGGKLNTPTKAKVVAKTSKVKPTIHIVDIIDCSGSMSGEKIRSAVLGINNGIENLRKDTKANYKYTLCDFSDSRDINFKYSNSDLIDVKSINFGDRGMTALYDAIGITLNKVNQFKDSKDKVLVNIYTDGGENGSISYSESSINQLINELKSKGFTVTFIGTERDTMNVISKLGIDKSNTLSYDGSAQGLKMSMEKTVTARAMYSTAVADGQDVSKGFYKNINK